MSPDGLCVFCHESCGTCVGPNLDDCVSCKKRYDFLDGKCIKLECQIGWLADHDAVECVQCHESCHTCMTTSASGCMICAEQTLRVKIACVPCESVEGFYTEPTEPECQEICGDGIKVSDLIECDDGNLDPLDGCNELCEVEQSFVCSGGSPFSGDECYYREPITWFISVAPSDITKVTIQFDRDVIIQKSKRHLKLAVVV